MSEAQGVSEPTVCCVMLTRDRPALAARAVRCFQRQTYERKVLLIVDSGKVHMPVGKWKSTALRQLDYHQASALSIGTMRNVAASFTEGDDWSFRKPEIMCHWDDDDYSHPYRIAEQVDLLMTSKKQVVGYRDMLFWRTSPLAQVMGPLSRHFGTQRAEQIANAASGEAWLYTHAHQSYCLGTSLCYWREVWERKPFGDQPRLGKMTGEDHDFLEGLDSLGWTSLDNPGAFDRHHDSWGADRNPRMIASIHGGNTSGQYTNMEPPSWERVPEWDKECRRIMEET